MSTMQPADRLREIAAQSGDNLLLGTGAPHPDAKLLDQCGEALSLFERAARLMEERAGVDPQNGDTKRRAQRDAMLHESWACKKRGSAILRQIHKVKATTTAGIYAKALCVRTRSGATVLAMSLAEDLVSNPALRMSLWAEQPEAAPVVATNVVMLAPRSKQVAQPVEAAPAPAKKRDLSGVLNQIADALSDREPMVPA